MDREKGTKAADMKNQISGDVKEKRSKRLIELSDKNEKEYNKTYIGKEVEVLFEEEKNGMYVGHTQNYIMIHCKTEQNVKNKTINVKCKEVMENSIVAEM